MHPAVWTSLPNPWALALVFKKFILQSCGFWFLDHCCVQEVQLCDKQGSWVLVPGHSSFLLQSKHHEKRRRSLTTGATPKHSSPAVLEELSGLCPPFIHNRIATAPHLHCKRKCSKDLWDRRRIASCLLGIACKQMTCWYWTQSVDCWNQWGTLSAEGL